VAKGRAFFGGLRSKFGRRQPRAIDRVALTLFLALALTGCGGSSNSSEPPVPAVPQFTAIDARALVPRARLPSGSTPTAMLPGTTSIQRTRSTRSCGVPLAA